MIEGARLALKTATTAESIAKMSKKLEAAIERGKKEGKKALYFGCWDRPGHYLHDTHGRSLHYKDVVSLAIPWTESLMDGTLLKNGKHPDIYDGKVFWTCGGLSFWYAFFWWDRSVDTRGACNSGFYVRGFGWPEIQESFDYACTQFPKVVSRQKHPLILQNPTPPVWNS